MSKHKKVYKLSASLINAYLYYRSNKSDTTYISFVKTLIGAFETNKWLERGLKYEDEVFEGKHGKISQLVKGLDKQKWGNYVVEHKDFFLRLAGKVDVIDKVNHRIYDIKRVDSYTDGKYSDENTVQHLIYFLLFPDVTDFYYLVVTGKDDVITGHHVVHVERPKQEELIQKIKNAINEFFEFLEMNNLLDLYQKAQKYEGR